MGMSTHIVGYMKSDDEIWQINKKVYEACIEADVEIPTKITEYFDDEDPRIIPGKEVDLGKCLCEFTDGESSVGFEVDVSKIPEKVKFIRFFNSY